MLIHIINRFMNLSSAFTLSEILIINLEGELIAFGKNHTAMNRIVLIFRMLSYKCSSFL